MISHLAFDSGAENSKKPFLQINPAIVPTLNGTFSLTDFVLLCFYFYLMKC